MKPVKFEGVNIVYAEKQPEYQPLPAMRFPDGTVISCWELTDEDVEVITKSKRLYIGILTFNHPLQPIRPAAELSDLIDYQK